HISHEGLELEDPSNEPNYDHVLVLSQTPQKAPDKTTYLTIDFEKGIPVAVDGQKMKLSDIIRKLNKIGGENGIGIIDIVENRVVGMKSRGVYETPGGTILYKAHELLEMITLDRDTAHYKKLVAQKYGELVYNGKWFSPLREALAAFVDNTQQTVTGDVKLKLYKGNVINAGVTSPYTLYDENVASFGDDGGAYDQTDATGFINLFGLPTKVKALLDAKRDNK
ncbi:MAG TPA: argininosuccinate synthase, partial [Ruminococcaceae bacterium]|nr:argininosuccinate synthase [Oscillospiraceae bacterium]